MPSLPLGSDRTAPRLPFGDRREEARELAIEPLALLERGVVWRVLPAPALSHRMPARRAASGSGGRSPTDASVGRGS
jgi:hypothetical protein